MNVSKLTNGSRVNVDFYGNTHQATVISQRQHTCNHKITEITIELDTPCSRWNDTVKKFNSYENGTSWDENTTDTIAIIS